MKNLITCLVLLAIFTESQATNYKVMTYNILCERCSGVDSSVSYWPDRRDLLFSVINSESPDLVGLQEVMGPQYDQIMAEFSDKYHVTEITTGSIENASSPHTSFRNVSLVKKSKFNLTVDGIVRMDLPDPEADARFERGFLQLELKEINSDNTVFFINTHYDHKSSAAKKDSSIKIRKHIYSALVGPTILVGDFNSDSITPPEEENDPIKLLTENYPTQNSLPVLKDLICSGDFNSLCGESTYLSLTPTVTNWRLDYIFGTNQVRCDNAYSTGTSTVAVNKPIHLTFQKLFTEGAPTERYEQLTQNSTSDSYPSDHKAIVCELDINFD